jgi:DUF2075 family protein
MAIAANDSQIVGLIIGRVLIYVMKNNIFVFDITDTTSVVGFEQKISFNLF